MDNGANAERSLRDDLSEALKDIEARELAAPVEEEAQAPEAEANAEPTETQSNRGDGRDAHGRFVSKTGQQTKEGEGGRSDDNSLGNPQAPQETTEEAPAPTPESSEPDAAPKSWRADEAKVWSQLPPEAKAAILRREQDNARTAGANDAERMFGREFAEIIRPHMEVINSFGVSPQFAVRALLDNDRLLRSGTPEQKITKARQLLVDYGIDPAALQLDPNVDPQIHQLRNELIQLQSRLSAPQQQNFAPLPPTQEDANIMAEIEAFRSDPAHPHFDAVHAQMGKLLETGAAPDLESAYQAAVAMTPALRSTVATPAQPQRTTEEKTAAARRASASVTGSPGPTGSPTPMSLRDELRENLRSAGFSV